MGMTTRKNIQFVPLKFYGIKNNNVHLKELFTHMTYSLSFILFHFCMNYCFSFSAETKVPRDDGGSVRMFVGISAEHIVEFGQSQASILHLHAQTLALPRVMSIAVFFILFYLLFIFCLNLSTFYNSSQVVKTRKNKLKYNVTCNCCLVKRLKLI